MNTKIIEKCINKLCEEIGCRPAGSDGNHEAMRFLCDDYEGDHSFFWTRNIPTMALCGTEYFNSYYSICHTRYDRPELLNYEGIKDVAEYVYALIHELGK